MCGHLGIVSLNGGHSGSHLNGFAHLTELQLCINPRRAGCGDGNVLTNESLEARGADIHAIGAWQQVGQTELAGTGGGGLCRSVGIAIDQRKFSPSHSGTTGVGNNTGDAAPFGLGKQAEHSDRQQSQDLESAHENPLT